MAGYLSLAELKLRTLMPAAYIDEIEVAEPGWVVAQLEAKSRWIDARLSKRYAAPFIAPHPDCILDWLARITTLRCWLKKGFDPTDRESAEYVKDAQTAEAEVAEAANSVSGLFDLPLRSDTTASGITKGGPVVYAEVSPYTWTTRQREAAEWEI